MWLSSLSAPRFVPALCSCPRAAKRKPGEASGGGGAVLTGNRDRDRDRGWSVGGRSGRSVVGTGAPRARNKGTQSSQAAAQSSRGARSQSVPSRGFKPKDSLLRTLRLYLLPAVHSTVRPATPHAHMWKACNPCGGPAPNEHGGRSSRHHASSARRARSPRRDRPSTTHVRSAFHASAHAV